MNSKRLAIGDAVEAVLTLAWLPNRKPTVTPGKVVALREVEGHPYAHFLLSDGRKGFTTVERIGAKGSTSDQMVHYRLA